MNEDDFFSLLMQSRNSGLYGGVEGMTRPSAAGNANQLIDPIIRGGLGNQFGSLGVAVPTAEYDQDLRLEGNVNLPLLGGLLGLSGSYTPNTRANEANLSYRTENNGNTFGISGLLGDTGFGQKYSELMADYIRQLAKDEYLGFYGGLRNEKPFVGVNYRNRF
jgi:hypothetical protein